MTSPRPARIVDAHVHLWDPARTDWYPYLSGRQQLDMGDVTGMSAPLRRPDLPAESAGWNVEKLVNVAAATGHHSIDETLELDRRADADGHPDAIVGGLPPTRSVAEAARCSIEQMAAPRFRGVRPMGAVTSPLPARRCAPRPAGTGPAVRADGPPRPAPGGGRRARGLDDLVVVVEHTGWPRSGAEDELALWRRAWTRWPRSATTWCASCRAWRCRWGRWSADVLAPWLSTPSSSSASTAACSPATSPSTACTARSTSSTPPSPSDRAASTTAPRQALRRERRAHLPLLSTQLSGPASAHPAKGACGAPTGHRWRAQQSEGRVVSGRTGRRSVTA